MNKKTKCRRKQETADPKCLWGPLGYPVGAVGAILAQKVSPIIGVPIIVFGVGLTVWGMIVYFKTVK